MSEGDPIHGTYAAGIDDAAWPRQTPVESDDAPRRRPSWRLRSDLDPPSDRPDDDHRNLDFPPVGDLDFPPVDRSDAEPDDYPTEPIPTVEPDDTDTADFGGDPPLLPPMRVGLQARAIAAGLRWLYKENEAGEIVPRKGVVRTVAIGGVAVMGTLVGLRYGSEIVHSLQGSGHDLLFSGSGTSHAAANHALTQPTGSVSGNTAHGTATSTGTRPASASPKPTPSGTRSKPGKVLEAPKPTHTVASAPSTTQKPDERVPSLPKATPSAETVTIGAHHKNSVWGELQAQNPNWTNAQIASAIDNTQQATGQNLNHVTAGEQVKLLAPQAPIAPDTPAEHAAQLHAHGVHGGNVAPIQQPADSSVVYLQTGAAHNSVDAVVAQALQSNNISIKPNEFNKLVTDVVSYNHMQNVDEHSLPVGWPVYIPPEAMLRHLLEEIGK